MGGHDLGRVPRALHEQVFPASARHLKAWEFLELKQGNMTVLEYVAKFTVLARFEDDYVAIDMAKVRKFEDGLKLSIQGKIIGFLLQDLDSLVRTAMAIEREILFDFDASHSFITASCVEELGLEVEILEKSLYVSSPLGTRVSVQLIYQNCELEISGILLKVDLKVMDMSNFNVILSIDWLTAHQVFIDYNRRRVTAYTQDGVCVVL